jgi:hypothetical protein
MLYSIITGNSECFLIFFNINFLDELFSDSFGFNKVHMITYPGPPCIGPPPPERLVHDDPIYVPNQGSVGEPGYIGPSNSNKKVDNFVPPKKFIIKSLDSPSLPKSPSFFYYFKDFYTGEDRLIPFYPEQMHFSLPVREEGGGVNTRTYYEGRFKYHYCLKEGRPFHHCRVTDMSDGSQKIYHDASNLTLRIMYDMNFSQVERSRNR